MRGRKSQFCLIGILCGVFFVGGARAQQTANEKPRLSAAIFVVNHAGEEYNGKLDVLNDMISTRLAEKGFSVINHNEVLNRFHEYSERERDSQKNEDILTMIRSLLNENDSGSNSLDDLISSYSAKKIAQMVHADYLIIASINSVGRESRSGVVFGQKMGSVTTTMRVSLKVLEGNQGGAIAGAIVEVKDRQAIMDGVQIENSDLSNQLLDQCAQKVVQEIGGKVDRIQNIKVAVASTVGVSISSNVEGAEVAIDGVVYGATPCSIRLPVGPASITISKEWFKPVEKFINPHEGQQLNFTLQMTCEGIKRWKSIENFKMEQAKKQQKMEMEKSQVEHDQKLEAEQSSTDAYVKKMHADADKIVAEGEKKMLENSWVHDEGKEKQEKE